MKPFRQVRVHPQLPLQFNRPTSPAGVPCRRKGIGRPFARCISLRVSPTFLHVEPSPGSAVRHIAVLVSGTCFLGYFTPTMVLKVVPVRSNVPGPVRLTLLVVETISSWVTKVGLLLVLITCVS